MAKIDEKQYSFSCIRAIRPFDRWVIRLLIVSGIIVMAVFLVWFIQPDHMGDPLIFWMLCAALLFKLAKMIQEWYHYWAPSIPPRPPYDRNYEVDIFTTFCAGEPREMVVATLHAMQAIRHPHTSYLCDEADDQELKKVCHDLGVVHVTRTDKINAKAGNINNALKKATGDICVILDPDHAPVPEFLDRTQIGR